MVNITIPIPDSLFQRLEAHAQETGRPLAEIASELLVASLASASPPQDRREQSLAILKEISGSLSIPDLDVNKHDLYVVGLEDDDDGE